MAITIPKFYVFPFAEDGQTTAVPNATQTGAEDGAVSYQEGWSDDYDKLIGDVGYRPIDRQKHNSLFNSITTNLQQWQIFGTYDWNSTESGDPGYHKYARVRIDNGGDEPAVLYQVYESLIDGNNETLFYTTSPAFSNWVLVDASFAITNAANIEAVNTAVGISVGDTNLGTITGTGTIVTNNGTVKAGIIELDEAATANEDDITALQENRFRFFKTVSVVPSTGTILAWRVGSTQVDIIFKDIGIAAALQVTNNKIIIRGTNGVLSEASGSMLQAANGGVNSKIDWSDTLGGILLRGTNSSASQLLSGKIKLVKRTQVAGEEWSVDGSLFAFGNVTAQEESITFAGIMTCNDSVSELDTSIEVVYTNVAGDVQNTASLFTAGTFTIYDNGSVAPLENNGVIETEDFSSIEDKGNNHD